MKRLYTLALLATGILIACSPEKKPVVQKDNATHRPAPVQPAPIRLNPDLTTDVLLPFTPVKDQGHSSLCWVYAMLATIETEHLTLNDSVNLSPDFVARHFLKEQAAQRFMEKDKRDITTRGISSMLLRLIQTYGVTRYDSFHRPDDCNMNILCRSLQQIIDTSPTLEKMNEHIDGKMDEEMGPVPRYVFMEGVEYTTLEFAHSVCRDDEYECLTSFNHHPYGERFVLEVPDNRYHDTFLNQPIDTLMGHIVTALNNGHPVCWEGDASEKGFSFETGMARLYHEDRTATQERRQHSFENGQTTDDHCMEIIGMAHDKDGKQYFICKNSWGTGNPYGGLMYLTENYVRLKTVAVVIPKEAFIKKKRQTKNKTVKKAR